MQPPFNRREGRQQKLAKVPVRVLDKLRPLMQVLQRAGHEGVNQQKKSYLLSLRNQLLGYLKRDHPTETRSGKMIRPVGMDGADLPEVYRGQFLDSPGWIFPSIQTFRLQSVNGAIVPEQ